MLFLSSFLMSAVKKKKNHPVYNPCSPEKTLPGQISASELWLTDTTLPNSNSPPSACVKFSQAERYSKERGSMSQRSLKTVGRISVSHKKKVPGKDNLRWTLKGQEKILPFQGDEPFNYHLDNNQIHFLPKNKAVLFSSSRHFSQLILRKIEENL